MNNQRAVAEEIGIGLGPSVRALSATDSNRCIAVARFSKRERRDHCWVPPVVRHHTAPQAVIPHSHPSMQRMPPRHKTSSQ